MHSKTEKSYVTTQRHELQAVSGRAWLCEVIMSHLRHQASLKGQHIPLPVFFCLLWNEDDGGDDDTLDSFTAMLSPVWIAPHFSLKQKTKMIFWKYWSNPCKFTKQAHWGISYSNVSRYHSPAVIAGLLIPKSLWSSLRCRRWGAEGAR